MSDQLTILIGDNRETMKQIPDGTVQCVVTSPPYFGLRSYLPEGHANERAEIGKEDTVEEFVAALVSVFREVWRVLREDGICFINLGDSYSRAPENGRNNHEADCGAAQSTKVGSLDGYVKRNDRHGTRSGAVGPNMLHHLLPLQECSAMCFRNAAAIGITSNGVNIPIEDERFPYRKLLCLLGLERITIKQRNNNFCQVLNLLTGPCYCWIGVPVAFASMHASHLEIVVDECDGLSIVVSDLNPNTQSEFLVSVGAVPVKSKNTSFSIEKSAEPISKSIIDGQTIGYPVSFDAPLKHLPDINFVEMSIPFPDGITDSAHRVSDLAVTHASPQQFSLSSQSCRVNLHASFVGHNCFLHSSHGWFQRWDSTYTNAIRKSNALRFKQELGIPDLVKRALMEDGWICRSTIIWAKGVSFCDSYSGSSMPESVKDRPSNSHEKIYMLTKSPNYFADMFAVQEQSTCDRMRGPALDRREDNNGNDGLSRREISGTRNLRNVWTINTENSQLQHFAKMPSKLASVCIQIGTSSKGRCPKCLAPWERVVEDGEPDEEHKARCGADSLGGYNGTSRKNHAEHGVQDASEVKARILAGMVKKTTTGWKPTCSCAGQDDRPGLVFEQQHPEFIPVPCTVLDPFSGTGTTGKVAIELGRKAILCELNPDYADITNEQTRQQGLALY